MTGFSIPEIDGFVEGLKPEEPGNPKDDALPPVVPEAWSAAPATSGSWTGHRLICGDALLGGGLHQPDGRRQTARMIFSDPPYNVPIAGHVSGSGNVKHREFAMASGEMSRLEFTAFLTTACSNMATASGRRRHRTSSAWTGATWRRCCAAGQAAFTEFKNLIVWVKDNGGMGTFYRSKHELIFAFKIGTAPHINSFELGQHGRYRTNVWSYKGVNSFGAGRDEEICASSDGEARRDDCRCHQGCLGPRRRSCSISSAARARR